MATPARITCGRRQRPLPLPPARVLLAAVTTAAVLSILCLLYFTDSLSYLGFQPKNVDKKDSSRKYLYWGGRVDCPGKQCGSCAGLGHQESSLRCALEEALFLDRIFVMPSRMCLSSVHNIKGILDSSNATSDQRWETSYCATESLYDMDLISRTVPIILDNPQSWFMECKDRTKRSSVMLPYTFLPTMPARKPKDVANKALDYLQKTRGIERSKELAQEHANRAIKAIESLLHNDDEDVLTSRRALIDHSPGATQPSRRRPLHHPSGRPPRHVAPPWP